GGVGGGVGSGVGGAAGGVAQAVSKVASKNALACCCIARKDATLLKENNRMESQGLEWLLLEAGIALGLFVFIVWWTMKK
ncbi:MAG: hypothetical protein ABL877_13575, partial [Thiobacillus sp.]